MNFTEFLSYIAEIAEDKELDLDDLCEALVLCGKPQIPVTEFERSSCLSRLTDHNLYPARHR